MRILDHLVTKLRLSSTTKARNLLKMGYVYVDGEVVVKADTEVKPGQKVDIIRSEARTKKRAPFEILYEDADILIAVKPAGILSVNRENEQSKTFYKIVNAHVREASGHKERVFLTHRLDRAVSGIMIFAKSIQVEKLLERGWSENDKWYYAVVEGTPQKPAGTIESWLAENAALKVYSTTQRADAKHAVTHYRVIAQRGKLSLIEVRLQTGRKNQIRVHMADLGCPIVGDLKYGARTDPIGRIALHAFHFSCDHPISGKRITVEAPLPPEVQGLLGN